MVLVISVVWEFLEMQQQAWLQFLSSPDSPSCHVHWKTAFEQRSQGPLMWRRQPRCAPVTNGASWMAICRHKQPPPDCYFWWRRRTSAEASSPLPPNTSHLLPHGLTPQRSLWGGESAVIDLWRHASPTPSSWKIYAIKFLISEG